MTNPESHSDHHQYDVLIIGSGAAGLSMALRLAPHARIGVLSKNSLTEGSTWYAQGGISAVLHQQDSIASHVADTLVAGAELCDERIVCYTVTHGREIVRWLQQLGVTFTHQPLPNGGSTLHLTREGGHSHRRVAHAADATGKAIESSLADNARSHPHIDIRQFHIAIDLLTSGKLIGRDNICVGAYVLNLQSGKVEVFKARFVVLATGGASKAYLYTSNPDTCSGDGIAMAWRAGCRVANMEFMQFHPTCLYHPKAKTFLVTEALRGEGAKLRLPDGTEFMDRFDPRGVLAPRDIVARAIDHEMKRLGIDCVYLDISHKPADFITSHFPTVYSRCLEFGIDITREQIPVVPAAHYTCGGVMTDIHARTDIQNLYAIGEVSYTGLHGANRMASNSLLECLVFARSASEHLLGQLDQSPYAIDIPPWDESKVTDSDEEVVVAHNWDELRRFMSDYVGIVRTTKRLQRAKRRVDMLRHEIDEYYNNFRVTNDLIELRDLSLVSDLIIRCAMIRKESRGLHYILDYPEKDASMNNVSTVLIPNNFAARS
ncbi:MAG: L-aspartate oxidase [Gammaproteobacteria bacterium]|nr:L-aspartate oxidase [Gammaproteobacteria bacterium]